MTGFEKILNPKAAAVVGVSTSNPFSPGNVIFRKLCFEHALPTYPINPRGGEVEGQQVYKSISEAPQALQTLRIGCIPTSAELDCWRTVHAHNCPHQSLDGRQTIQAWPVHEPGWKREIIRAEVEFELV